MNQRVLKLRRNKEIYGMLKLIVYAKHKYTYIHVYVKYKQIDSIKYEHVFDHNKQTRRQHKKTYKSLVCRVVLLVRYNLQQRERCALMFCFFVSIYIF